MFVCKLLFVGLFSCLCYPFYFFLLNHFIFCQNKYFIDSVKRHLNVINHFFCYHFQLLLKVLQ